MPQNVICFDIDGTLVDKHGTIHPADVAILKDGTDALFIAATGRPLQSLRSAFQRNGVLAAGQPIPFPLVLQNGAEVYLHNEILLRRTPFPAESRNALLEAATAHSDVTAYIFYADRIEVLWLIPAATALHARFDLNAIPFTGMSPAEPVTKGMFIAGKPADLDLIVRALRPFSLELAYSLPTVLEVNPPGINKGEMFLMLLSELGAERGVIAAAGDGENDLPLFEHASITFCPITAPAFILDRVGHPIDTTERGLLTPILEHLEHLEQGR